ncbi:hypothetical protein CSW98_08820 [Vibrio sp. HA2012]|uniref:glycosyltransferase n=1 Tax=Vibrio sp. HA2012 TaxID=1971595 RepID=UPI000C2B8117|nr:glycosyltransferase [Vibrio sp. HA2012]PJC86311.1 hypothetical protein CSW98_08820 [Vibrio sp. HA2012]
MLNINISPEIFHSQTVGGISRYFSELNKIESSELKINCDVIFGNNLYMPGRYRIYNNRYINRLQRLINKNIYRLSSSDIRHISYYDFDSFSSNSSNIITVYDCIHEKLGVDSNDDRVVSQKRKCIKNADKIISISNTTAQDVIDIYGVSSNKIKTIYLGVDFLEGVNVSVDSFNSDRPYILFVGNRNGYKNFSTLLDAYSMSFFRRNGGMLVAFGAPPTLEEMKELDKLGLSEEEVSFVQGDDCTLTEFYRNAYLHVVPSLYEGFGLTPFESIASGCRTIVHCNSVFEELFSPYGFVFDLTEKDELSHLIDSCSLEKIASENMDFLSNNKERFTWDNMREETANFYKSL